VDLRIPWCLRRLGSLTEWNCGARLQSAIGAVSQEGVSSQQASKLLKPLMTAVDMVFGSAAALSATFGSKVCTCPQD
jgi:hypothetical protein